MIGINKYSVKLPPIQLYHFTLFLGCPFGWKTRDGSCYKQASFKGNTRVDTFNYRTALDMCKNLDTNSYPAVVSNAGENNFLYKEYALTTVNRGGRSDGGRSGGRSEGRKSTVFTPVRIPFRFPGKITF